jgi:hypothetical protein
MSKVKIDYSHQDMMDGLSKAAIAILVFIGGAAIASCFTGCLPVRSQADMERDFHADVRACSLTAKTKDDARLCRIGVYRSYGLCDAPWPAVTPCDEE